MMPMAVVPPGRSDTVKPSMSSAAYALVVRLYAWNVMFRAVLVPVM